MVVRSNRRTDCLFAFALFLPLFYAVREAIAPDFVARCSGVSRWACETAKSARDYPIAGLNPVWLAMSGLFLAGLTYLLRRLVSGQAGLVGTKSIQLPTWYGSASAEFSDLRSVQIKSKMFGQVWSANLVTKSGRRLALWNFKPSELALVREHLKSNLPAPPATPPAT